MWISNYIALIGWLLIIIGLFASMPPQKAVIIAVLGSFLFLPMSTIRFSIPLLPSLNKNTSIAYGIIFGEMFSGAKAKHPLKMGSYDIPMLLFCFVSPLASSLSNGLGLNDGILGIIGKFFSYGIFFWAGRRYFGTPSSMRALTMAIMTAGLICVPMVAYEVRMSPQLHTKIYGFFQHDWGQMFRQGGFRPILFMSHGLMVALWMTVATTIAFWLWRTKEVAKVWKVSSALSFGALAVAAVLCKSSGAFVFLLLGLAVFFVYGRRHSSKLMIWMILFIPFYFYFRLSNIITVPQLETFVARYFEPDRVASLMIRLSQEDLFGAKALLRPLFGWGWMGRAWPVDANTGVQLIQMVDSLWIIILGTSGLFGLVTIYFSLGIGSLRVLATSGRPRNLAGSKTPQYATDAVVLSIVVAFFLLDSLQNAMVAPIYILCSGALISYYIKGGEEGEPE